MTLNYEEILYGPESTLEDNKITICKDEQVLEIEPLTLMEICCTWFEVAKDRNWDYKDDRGLVVSDSQIDQYIRMLENARKT